MKRQAILVCLLVTANFALADTIRGINIDFVTIGNADNQADTQVMNDGTTGYGAVNYEYHIGKYEVTNAQWNAFTTAAGIPTGNPIYAYDQSADFTDAQQPTNNVSWYQTLQFCNYLTSGDKSKGAYLFSGNNSNPGDFCGIDRAAAQAIYGTIYVLPTEDEWYKAAYFTGNGYSLYANGLNTIPTADNGWNYDGGSYSVPWNVGTGTQEQNGTFDMMGNVCEWNESPVFGHPYGSYRGVRGGFYFSGVYDTGSTLSSSYRGYDNPAEGNGSGVGFRVAFIPEPASLLLLALGGLLIRKR